MKKIFFFFISFIFLIQCSEYIPDDNDTYYKFSNDDYINIINYEYNINDILTYKNQFGEQLHFKVVE